MGQTIREIIKDNVVQLAKNLRMGAGM